LKPLEITLEMVKEAREALREVVRTTPLSFAQHKGLRDKNVYLKQENFQLTGSFKIRGAVNKIASLTAEEKSKGVIAASAGNHAQGVAFGAEKYGVDCHIVMPETAPLVKVTRTKEYGSKVTLHGRYFDEAFAKASEISEADGATFVHPYKDPMVIAGQGTIGLEIFEGLPEVENVIVPIGGGGLISGIAFTLKALKPDIKIYGVVVDQTPGMKELKSGSKRTNRKQISTIADGIAVKNPSEEMFQTYIDKYVEEIVEVTDEEIAQAIVYLLEYEKSVVEGSGAAGLAAILSNKLELTGQTCVVLCGGNIDLNMVNSVIDTGLRKQGRIARISTVVSDLPGALAKMTNVIAKKGANIVDVVHDRVHPDLSVRETRIDFYVETIGFEHIQILIAALKKQGAHIINELEGDPS